MRTYEKTHPWIRFEIDFRPAPIDFWMDLGEIKSKCEHIAGVPLDSDTAKELYRVYLSRGVHATTAIEGNTLSEEQVLQEIDGRSKLPESSRYLGREVENIINACNTILGDVVTGTLKEITVDLIENLNGRVLAGLPVAENVIPGKIRDFFVGVGGYRGAPAEDCRYLLERTCAFLKEERDRTDHLDPMVLSVILAVVAHLYIAWIHPFGDGNGRTARLLEFLILLDGGVPAPAAHLLSNHYNQTRQAYYRTLERASVSGGDVLPFLQYAVKGMLDGLRKQLTEIRSYQLKMIWRDHTARAIESGAAGESEAVRMRRRDLVLALSERDAPVKPAEIALLTPVVARAYGARTSKTISRDVNALRDLGLVEVDRRGVRARTETILAFLPRRKGER
jgi:Fic family protein